MERWHPPAIRNDKNRDLRVAVFFVLSPM